MGLFKKATKAAGYGGTKECKYCGQKKTIMSSYGCDASPTRKHVWVKAS